MLHRTELKLVQIMACTRVIHIAWTNVDWLSIYRNEMRWNNDQNNKICIWEHRLQNASHFLFLNVLT